MNYRAPTDIAGAGFLSVLGQSGESTGFLDGGLRGGVVTSGNHSHSVSGTCNPQSISGDAETRPNTATLNYIIKLYSDTVNGVSVGVPIADATTPGLVNSFAGGSKDLDSGTWQPVEDVGSRVNVSATTPLIGKYLKVGDVVTCSVRIAVDPTSTGPWGAEFNFPIPTDAATTVDDCSGVGTRNTGPGDEAGTVRGSVLGNRFRIGSNAISVSNASAFWHFTYRVR